MSEAVQACAAPAAVNSPIGTVVVVPAPVCLQAKTVEVLVVMSTHSQCQPCDAVGNPTVPVLAAPPVPTLTVKLCGPLLLAMEGLLPKPLEIVGAVPKLVDPSVFPVSMAWLAEGMATGSVRIQLVANVDGAITPM